MKLAEELLKRCPFCGGIAGIQIQVDEETYEPIYIAVECRKCHAGVTGSRIEEPIRKWNERREA